MRAEVAVPFASGIVSDGRSFWLDEDVRAPPGGCHRTNDRSDQPGRRTTDVRRVGPSRRVRPGPLRQLPHPRPPRQRCDGARDRPGHDQPHRRLARHPGRPRGRPSLLVAARPEGRTGNDDVACRARRTEDRGGRSGGRGSRWWEVWRDVLHEDHRATGPAQGSSNPSRHEPPPGTGWWRDGRTVSLVPPSSTVVASTCAPRVGDPSCSSPPMPTSPTHRRDR